ncbi:MAG: glycosyltransferase [Rhodospirillales bacterium]|nr:glycosyltransferase [Rhodospirillales bacterium]
MDAPAPPLTRFRLLSPWRMVAVAAIALMSGLIWAWVAHAVPVPAAPMGAGGKPIDGFAFSPFRAGESPVLQHLPSIREIRADLVRLAPLTDHIRTYTVQGTLGDIPRLAAPLGFKVTLGIWLDRDKAHNRAELRRAIAIARHNRDVAAVVVGNETLLRGDLRVGQLLRGIQTVRAAVHVPVTTAEPWHIWLAHPELAAAVDQITVHILPYWEGVPEHDALTELRKRLAMLRAAYPGKPIVIGETGWPSQGATIGGAIASPTRQARYIRTFLAAAPSLHARYFLMEAFDQPWKTATEGRAGGYWGFFTLGRAVKFGMVGPVSDHRAWPECAAASIVTGSVLALLFLWARTDLSAIGSVGTILLCQAVASAAVIVPMRMGELYLPPGVAIAWIALILAQSILFLVILTEGFEMMEALCAPRRRTRPTGDVMRGHAMPAAQPFVSIHMPICNEPAVLVCRSLDALSRLDYAHFEVLVIDNNSSSPAVWEPVAQHCARLGARFRFLTLGEWPGHKAGALNEALRHTAAEAALIAVLDADYEVSPHWLREAVPCFDDPELGFFQSPQDYRDREESLFKRLLYWEYAGFFSIGMRVRNDCDAIIQHGTMTVIRRTALIGVGGWAEWCLTEDAELGLRLLAAGWHSLYHPVPLGHGVMPDDLGAWRRQRARWAFGAMQIWRRHGASMLLAGKDRLSLPQRRHFIAGWLPWLADGIGLGFLVGSLIFSVMMMLAPHLVASPSSLFVLPVLASFLYRVARMLVLYRCLVPCSLRDRIGATFAGLALTHSIGFSVLAGLAGRKRPFNRTAKLQPMPRLMQALGQVQLDMALLASGAGILFALAALPVHDRATLLWMALLGVQLIPSAAAILLAALATAGPGKGKRAAPWTVQAGQRLRPVRYASRIRLGG